MNDVSVKFCLKKNLNDVSGIRFETRHVVGRHIAAARAERQRHVVLRILKNKNKNVNCNQF